MPPNPRRPRPRTRVFVGDGSIVVNPEGIQRFLNMREFDSMAEVDAAMGYPHTPNTAPVFWTPRPTQRQQILYTSPISGSDVCPGISFMCGPKDSSGGISDEHEDDFYEQLLTIFYNSGVNVDVGVSENEHVVISAPGMTEDQTKLKIVMLLERAGFRHWAPA